jgi:very-short-patch-repair endonuclease
MKKPLTYNQLILKLKKFNIDIRLCTEKWFNEVTYRSTTKIPLYCETHNLTFYHTLARIKKIKIYCPKCRVYNINTFLKDSKSIHKGKYDYKLVPNTITRNTLVKIICPEHGVFTQKAYNHSHYGYGCKACQYSRNQKLTFNEIKTRLPNLIFSPDINWSTDYTGTRGKKIKLICPEHGPYQNLVFNLFNGSGCPNCSNKSRGEKKINIFLKENKYSFKSQYIFPMLPKKRFDFYIEEFNLVIEYDGIQHFKAVKYFGGEAALQKTQERDRIKNQYCEENNINLLRIPYWEFNNIEKLIQEKIEYIYIKGIK